jgi:2-polyprenyl-3-methyl-5-hydroxy-6-metoxy-1,4-benzoquinol methylase
VIQLDPEERETAALALAAPDLAGRGVLEVGCGSGRLTRRYAHRTGSVLAIDPNAKAIAEFIDSMPPALRGHVMPGTGTIVTLGEPNAAYDVVLLSWSL